MFSYSTMMNNNLSWQHSLLTSVASVYSLQWVVKDMILMLLQSEECINFWQKKILLLSLLFKIPVIDLARLFFYRLFKNTVSNTLYSKKPTKLLLFSFKRKYIVLCPSFPNVLYLPLLSTPLMNNSFKQNQVFSWSPKDQTWTLDFLKTSSLIIAHG